MKKLMTLMLGMALAIGTLATASAQADPKKDDTKKDTTKKKKGKKKTDTEKKG